MIKRVQGWRSLTSYYHEQNRVRVERLMLILILILIMIIIINIYYLSLED